MRIEKTRLAELPTTITGLETQITELKALHPPPPKSDNPNLNLPLPATVSLLSERETELADIDAQIKVLQSQLPRKQRELERSESELHPLMNQRRTVIAQANEARQRKEQGGVDEIEERGRWYKAADATLRAILATGS